MKHLLLFISLFSLIGLQFHGLEHVNITHSEDCSLCLNSLDFVSDDKQDNLESIVQQPSYSIVQISFCSNKYFYSASLFKTGRAPPFQS
jgi:hypothetical protein